MNLQKERLKNIVEKMEQNLILVGKAKKITSEKKSSHLKILNLSKMHKRDINNEFLKKLHE